MAKANSNVCNDFVSRGNKIEPEAGDGNRTRVLSLGSWARQMRDSFETPDPKKEAEK
jgi:hypothetical protein